MTKKKNKEVDIKAKPETSASMDSLTQDEMFPHPDEEAIAAISAEQHPPSQELRRDFMAGFDPAIHATKEDGSPSITKGGKFRKKTAKFIKPEEKRAEKEAIKAAEISSKEAAVVCSGLIEQLSVKLISDDFIYSDPERASNIIAWEATFDHYGGVNLSPPAALALNHMAIILVRSGQPKTLSKFKQIGGWLKSKLKRKDKKHGALLNNRNDGQRQDNVGKEKSSQPATTGKTHDNP